MIRTCLYCGSKTTYLTDNVTDPLNPTYLCYNCDHLFTERDSLTSRPIDNNEPNDQHAKADEGKLQLTLVPRQIIKDIAEVRMYGNKKYGDPDNWKTVDINRYRDAMFRHFLAYLDDPHGVDEESGIPHWKHVCCNAAFISAMETYDK